RRPVPAREAASHGTPEPLRGGRRRPGDLRVARRGRAAHAVVSAGLPRYDPHQARAELPLHPGDPRRGERHHRGKRPPARQDAVHRAAGRGARHAAHGGGRAGRGGVARRRAESPGGRPRHGIRGDGDPVPHQWTVETARAAERIPDLRPNVRAAFTGVAALIDDLRARHGQADPATALEQVVAAVGYAQYLADEGPEGVERLENVQELIAGAAAWAETAEDDGDEAGEGGVTTGPTLIERYLTQAALVASADQSTGDPTGVTLMTVHM